MERRVRGTAWSLLGQNDNGAETTVKQKPLTERPRVPVQETMPDLHPRWLV